jgi:hypothetical protein
MLTQHTPVPQPIEVEVAILSLYNVVNKRLPGEETGSLGDQRVLDAGAECHAALKA